MHHTSSLEISTSAYLQNVEFIRSRIGVKPVISAVVKGNAYGHGIAQLVPIAEQAGVHHFSTFSSDEAREVLKNSSQPREIMIMGMLHLDEIRDLILLDIQFFVFDFERLEQAIEAAKTLKQKAKIHVEVETGFRRTGFEWDDREKLLKLLQDNHSHLELKGLCTHFAGAESAQNHTRILSQIAHFERYKGFFSQNNLHFERLHTACSAATLLFPETHMDLVRVGIAGYGFWPTRETFELIKNQLLPENRNPLKRLLTWKTQIMSLKKVNAGDYVGYGKSYQAHNDMMLAIIPVGYSHGYGRNLSNHGQVLISGIYCPVIGTVNMNAVAVDVSHLIHPQAGEEVILIGNQGENEITVGSFAETSDLVNYEMLTRLPSQIPRIIVD
ncbi:alanine racemase [Algoriphagus litoralis]|uniref:alanine racemase n=1 Tax=Algoriphagus litoralis TaxID=2202829 RepID=UPI000DBAA5BC|nr:alanine racemase [Algoriphagus litoralis]